MKRRRLAGFKKDIPENRSRWSDQHLLLFLGRGKENDYRGSVVERL